MKMAVQKLSVYEFCDSILESRMPFYDSKIESLKYYYPEMKEASGAVNGKGN